MGHESIFRDIVIDTPYGIKSGTDKYGWNYDTRSAKTHPSRDRNQCTCEDATGRRDERNFSNLIAERGEKLLAKLILQMSLAQEPSDIQAGAGVGVHRQRVASTGIECSM